jgi:hypothetical protein
MIELLGQTSTVSFEDFRPVHIGGNWGYNFHNLTNTATPTIPSDYFAWLNNVGVNWVGISVALNLESSLDSLVKRSYTASIPTFTDAALRATIRQLRGQGFHVYLTLAIEDTDARTSVYPLERWMLGDPSIPVGGTHILPENWPWSLQHPKHAQFVKSFFRTYTEQAVYFATIAQQEGVELFSLGTETERLFRTRSGTQAGIQWPNHFKIELQNMVSKTRKVYSGLLSYDMAYDGVTVRDFYGIGSDYLWSDLNLDVIGISAYFRLQAAAPALPMQLSEAQSAWSSIFTNHLLPLKQRNPTKPILFLEYGYTNSVGSPYIPASDEFTPKVFHDSNSNGLDDGEETQANIYKAFFAVNESNERLIKGAFLWGNEVIDDFRYDTDWNKIIHFGIKKKLAEKPVADYYTSIRDLPLVGNSITGDTLLCINPTNSSFTTASITKSTSYVWTLTPPEAGSVSGNGLTASVNWSNTFTGAAKISVQGKNAIGVGRPSALAIQILPNPIADFTLSFNNNSINVVNNSSNATSYSWTLNGTEVSSIASPVVEVTEAGSYSLSLTASNGACMNTLTKTIDLVVTGIEGEPEAFSMFPNPASSNITVRAAGQNSLTSKAVQLMDGIGRTIITEPMPDGELSIDVRGLSQGFYLLRILNEKNRTVQTIKVLIQ